MRSIEFFPRAKTILNEVIIVGDSNAEFLTKIFHQCYCIVPAPLNEVKYIFNDNIFLNPKNKLIIIIWIGNDYLNQGGHPEAFKMHLEDFFKNCAEKIGTTIILPPPFNINAINYWEKINIYLQNKGRTTKGGKYISNEIGSKEAIKMKLINNEGTITTKGIDGIVEKLKGIEPRLMSQKNIKLYYDESEDEEQSLKNHNTYSYHQSTSRGSSNSYKRGSSNSYKRGQHRGWRGSNYSKDISPIRNTRRFNIVDRLSFVSMIMILVIGLVLFVPLIKGNEPMICPHGINSKIYHIGHPTEHCQELFVHERQTIKDVSLEVYRARDTTQSISGWHCTKVMEKLTYYTNWLNYKIISPIQKIDLAVTKEDCLKMKHLNKCSDANNNLLMGDDDSKRTLNIIQPKFEYFSGGKEASESIENPMLDLAHCKLSENECVLKDNSVLIWNSPKENQRCNYIKLDTFKGTMYDKWFLNNDNTFSLSFTKPETITDCEKEYVKSDQLYVIKVVDYKEHFLEVKNKKKRSLNKLKNKLENLNLDGSVRVSQFSAGETAQRLTTEILLKRAYNHLAQTICKINAEPQFITSLDATTYARKKFGTPYIEAEWITEDTKSSEAWIEVWPCIELNWEKIKIRANKNNCTKDLPIMVKMEKYKNDLFLDPKKLIVKEKSEIGDCTKYQTQKVLIRGSIYKIDQRKGTLSEVSTQSIIETPKGSKWNKAPILDSQTFKGHVLTKINDPEKIMMQAFKEFRISKNSENIHNSNNNEFDAKISNEKTYLLAINRNMGEF
uniref:Uncharacterized protein n=1 Tax=Meloidogyne enterolobii TaxID=390850 RepID=A0A6V7XSQ0_MELEN|nr:unnamed protein product [Meloidogyne enterolobii]